MATANYATTSTVLPLTLQESRTELVYIVSAALTGASTIVFGLRLFTRCFLLKTAGPDDWTMLVAQILAIVAGVSTIVEAYYGLGRHIASLSESNVRSSIIALYCTILSYNLGLNVVKISFLLQYRRIFPNQLLRRTCLCLLIFTCLWTTSTIVILSISCLPFANIVPESASWCLDTLSVWEVTSIVSLVTDFAIFFIPLPCIWNLPIPRRQKSMLFGIFSLGFFVCIISIIRVPTLRVASKATDPTWDNVAAALWTLAEFNAAILCSSLPVLRPLFFKVSGALSYGKRSAVTATNLVEQSESAHRLRSLHKSPTMTKQTMLSNPGDSSEDLVTSTFDEMIYGPRKRQSSAHLNSLRHSPPAEGLQAEATVELGLSSIQSH